jgi:hypothetical protein
MIAPMSRSTLQNLKAKADEQRRLSSIEEFTKAFYSNVIGQAAKSTDSIYRFEVGVYHPGVTSSFVNDNKDDILSSLQKLFPDSLVEYKKLIKHRESTQKHVYYDISTVDQQLLPHITSHTIVNCIVIDWS